mgnify:CR=1 FL=1
MQKSIMAEKDKVMKKSGFKMKGSYHYGKDPLKQKTLTARTAPEPKMLTARMAEPKIAYAAGWHPDLTFKKAFRHARDAGAKKFTWRGKSYTTKIKK